MTNSSPTETDICTARSDRDFEKSEEQEPNGHERQQSQDAEVAPAPQQSSSYTPPNGGYGWVCVCCVFFINAHTWGINSSYGVFLAHYLSNNTFPGATYLSFAFVGSLSISQAMLVSPLATIVVGRFGTKPCLITGVLLETLALLAASWAKEFWQLLLSQGLCFGYGMGFLFVGSVGIIPQWFTTRRSLANGIGAAGSGLGGLMYSLSTQAIIQRASLGWAFRVLGIISGAVNLTCALLIRDRNKHIGSRHLAFDYKLFKRGEFWLVQGYGFFTMLGYIVLLFSLPNYANYVGLTAKQASVIGALLNLGQGLGRPPIGFFSDAFGRINMAGTMTFLSGLFALVIWTFATSYGVLIFYAIIAGTIAGTYWATIAPVSAEVVGLKDLPTALSITWLNLVIPDTFSEPIALEITAHTGSYLGTQLFVGFMYIAAFICLWFLKAWKIGEMERLAELEEKPPEAIQPTESREDAGISMEEEARVKPRTSFLKRMIIWRRV